MSKELLKYKDYSGSIEVSVEDGCLYGEVLFINDTVMYHANSVDELKAAFEEAVDQYLADCKALGREPNKEFSGTFNVRVGKEIHRELALFAYKNGQYINQVVKQALTTFLKAVDFANSGKISVDINHKLEHNVKFSYSGEIDKQVVFKEKPNWSPTIVRNAEVA